MPKAHAWLDSSKSFGKVVVDRLKTVKQETKDLWTNGIRA
jgi:hypothetical protein